MNYLAGYFYYTHKPPNSQFRELGKLANRDMPSLNAQPTCDVSCLGDASISKITNPNQC